LSCERNEGKVTELTAKKQFAWRITMSRYKISLRIVPLVVLLSAATLAWSQAPLAKGSFTLPMEARWGQFALVPGDYTFVISHDITSPEKVELRHDGAFVGFILAAARDDGNFNQSSMLLQRTGDTYAVKELRIGDLGVFSYRVPKVRMSQLAQGPATTSVPVRASGK
jgi:hypothetical protein